MSTFIRNSFGVFPQPIYKYILSYISKKVNGLKKNFLKIIFLIIFHVFCYKR